MLLQAFGLSMYKHVQAWLLVHTCVYVNTVGDHWSWRHDQSRLSTMPTVKPPVSPDDAAVPAAILSAEAWPGTPWRLALRALLVRLWLTHQASLDSKKRRLHLQRLGQKARAQARAQIKAVPRLLWLMMSRSEQPAMLNLPRFFGQGGGRGGRSGGF